MTSDEDQSVFRTRGVRVVIDTTETVEFDAKSHQISDARMERIGKQLRDTHFSPRDRTVGIMRVREIEGFDVAFILGREQDALVITIGRIELPDKDEPLEVLLKRLGPYAIFRGAIGL